jgi:hypothetical protein
VPNNLVSNQFADNFFGESFHSPWDLLIFYDEDFRDEKIQLYPWQREILETFSADVPLDDMIRMAVVANNGSGKSQYVLAPCAIWLAVAFKRSLAYVTSASASQLDTQTERFIDYLANKMNQLHRKEFNETEDIWKLIKRSKEFLPNSSSIDLFATDEPKKAEGKHPLPGGKEFAIFVDEGKSIDEAIYGAIDRCTGATRRLDISSAGGCFGHFYDICTKPELGWWQRKIKYSDTPHVKNKEFEQAVIKHGINDPLVRSIFFSEFTSVEDSTVLTREGYDKCRTYFTDEKIISVGDNKPRMGIDLSAGGDETVCSVWKGNVQIAIEAFRFYDTAQGVKEIISIQSKYGIENKNVWIEFDGFNRGIVDNLADKGFHYNKVLAAGKAFDSKRYSNRMTELWFEFKRYIEEGYMGLLPDQTQKNQFIGRYYKRSLQNSKIILESKKEARAKGHPSPDRADAAVIAWAGMPLIDEFLDKNVGQEARDRIAKQAPKYGRRVSEAEMTEFVDDLAYGDAKFFDDARARRRGKGRMTANSLDAIDKATKGMASNNQDEWTWGSR